MGRGLQWAGDFRAIEAEESWSISFRDASHSLCSIPYFRSSIKPCSTDKKKTHN